MKILQKKILSKEYNISLVLVSSKEWFNRFIFYSTLEYTVGTCYIREKQAKECELNHSGTLAVNNVHYEVKNTLASFQNYDDAKLFYDNYFKKKTK